MVIFEDEGKRVSGLTIVQSDDIHVLKNEPSEECLKTVHLDC